MQHSSPKKLHLCTVRCCDVHGRSVLSDLGGKKMSRSSTVYMWALKFGWVIGFAMLPPTILGDNCFHKEIQDITHCVNPAVLWTTEAPEKNKHLSRYRTFLFHIIYECNNVVFSSGYQGHWEAHHLRSKEAVV